MEAGLGGAQQVQGHTTGSARPLGRRAAATSEPGPRPAAPRRAGGRSHRGRSLPARLSPRSPPPSSRSPGRRRPPLPLPARSANQRAPPSAEEQVGGPPSASAAAPAGPATPATPAPPCCLTAPRGVRFPDRPPAPGGARIPPRDHRRAGSSGRPRTARGCTSAAGSAALPAAVAAPASTCARAGGGSLALGTRSPRPSGHQRPSRSAGGPAGADPCILRAGDAGSGLGGPQGGLLAGAPRGVRCGAAAPAAAPHPPPAFRSPARARPARPSPWAVRLLAPVPVLRSSRCSGLRSRVTSRRGSLAPSEAPACSTPPQYRFSGKGCDWPRSGLVLGLNVFVGGGGSTQPGPPARPSQGRSPLSCGWEGATTLRGGYRFASSTHPGRKESFLLTRSLELGPRP